MRHVTIGVVLALAFTFSQPASAPAQGGRDLHSLLDKLREFKEELSRAKDVYDYVSGVGEDIRKKKQPRKPKTDKFKKIDERLTRQLQSVRELKVSPPLNSKASEYDTTSEIKKGDKFSRRKAADKLVAFNRALRKQVAGMEAVGKELRDLAERARMVELAGSRLANKFADLYRNPVAVAAFRDTFGMAWLELEAKILPLLSDIRSEAERKGRDFRDETEKRRKALSNHTSSTKTLLQTWGLRAPSDLRD